MSNSDNLIPNTERSPNEVREMQKKGGIKSGETRRKKKKLRDAMTVLMDLPPSEHNKKIMKDYGIEDSEMTNQMMLSVIAFQKAAKGNIRAMEFIRDVMGGKDMSELDKAMIAKIKAETKKTKAETKKIEAELALADEEDESVVIVNDCE